jgi:hypothetical protein
MGRILECYQFHRVLGSERERERGIEEEIENCSGIFLKILFIHFNDTVLQCEDWVWLQWLLAQLVA